MKPHISETEAQDLVFALFGFLFWSSLPAVGTHSTILELERVFFVIVCWKYVICFDYTRLLWVTRVFGHLNGMCTGCFRLLGLLGWLWSYSEQVQSVVDWIKKLLDRVMSLNTCIYLLCGFFLGELMEAFIRGTFLDSLLEIGCKCL